MIKKFLTLSLFFCLFLCGCTLSGAASTPTVDTNAIVTAAASTAFAQLSATAGVLNVTPTPTLTPEPPTLTPQPTVEVKLVPYDAVCTYLAAVRSRPTKGGDSIGSVAFNHRVQVFARNIAGTWLYIDWPDAPSGKAWVTSQAFTLEKMDITRLPIAIDSNNGFYFIPPVIWEITGTPLPFPTLSSDPLAKTVVGFSGFALRVCPSKGCMVLGVLNAGDPLTLTGRYGENAWVQIEYPSGPGGKAWVIRDAFQASKGLFSGLPFYDVLGNLVTSEPPTQTPDPNATPVPTFTATVTPAGPLAEITDTTTVYSLMSSLSPVIGTLNPKDKIHITAASFNHLWFEIQYPADTDGRGYISVKYVKLLGDFRKLIYTDAQGTPFPTP